MKTKASATSVATFFSGIKCKHSTGGGCLYIKRLSDVDLRTLKKIVAASVKHAKKAGGYAAVRLDAAF